MSQMKIHLEPDFAGNAIYKPDDEIKGFVELYITKPLQLNSFIIYIGGQVTTQVYCKNILKIGNETIFCNRVNGFQYIQPRKIKVGIYRYDICYRLSKNLPYTVLISDSGKESFIAYFVKARLNVDGQPEKEVSSPFKILNDLDLNLHPSLRFGQQKQESIIFSRLFCQKENILLCASIPFSGFAVGQIIPITIQYRYRKSINNFMTNIKLIQDIHIKVERSIHPAKKIERTLISKSFPINKNIAQTVYFIEIPEDLLFISNDHICELIKIKYRLQIKSSTTSWWTSNEINFPITIGTKKIKFNPNYPAFSCYGSDKLRTDETREIVAPTAPSYMDLIRSCSDLNEICKDANASCNLVNQIDENNAESLNFDKSANKIKFNEN